MGFRGLSGGILQDIYFDNNSSASFNYISFKVLIVCIEIAITQLENSGMASCKSTSISESMFVL